MHWIDWLIVIVPMTLIMGLAWYSKRYARSVVDYLAAGRVAGRYVICVGDLTAGLSVIVLVAGCEASYQTGYAVGFWGAIVAPVGMVLSLSGFYIYRWRRTECLSMGQFLEIRYGSKFFRIFCAALQAFAEMVTNAIGPAIATNFFIYYLGLPHKITIMGVNLPCYGIIVFLCLTLAILFIWPGGRISLLVTDCIQGLFSYPIFVIIVGYIILNFSWDHDIIPVMSNRVAGQSFLNPYDISQLRDFNLFAIVVSLLGTILNRGVWAGNDTSGSGRTPHEQKMASVLGSWRNGFAYLMILLVAILVITFMNSPHFSKEDNRFEISNTTIRQKLSHKVLEEAVPNVDMRNNALAVLEQIPPTSTLPQIENGEITTWTTPLSQQSNLDTPYFDAVRSGLGDTPEARAQFQKYRSLYQQMLMPMTLRAIFPVGLVGLFCLLMIMLLVSTDDSRIFNSSTSLMQDIILPLYKNRLDKKTHILMLRLTAVSVAVFFFIVSLFFAQMDYINMFTTIMCAVWVGGAGSIMTFGLYSRFGNLTGAWCSLIFGSGTSALGLIFQRNWASSIYPFIESMGWTEGLNNFLILVSSPLDPWVKWQMNEVKFPINSYEIFFISMVLAVSTYIIGSLLTYKPYDLDKLLHRGKYAREGEIEYRVKWSFRTIISKIIGITPEYTTGDKVIAYAVFSYSFVYGTLLVFGGIVTWNVFYPWPLEWWTIKFFITSLVVPGIIGVISTVWFLWGGIRDGRQLFKDLEKRVENHDDNGQVL